MTAMLTAPQAMHTASLMATLELVGLQTHERDPGSDEWDDALSDVARTVIDAVDSTARVYLLTPPAHGPSPTRFVVEAEVVAGHDEELLGTLIEALTDHPTGVAVTYATCR